MSASTQLAAALADLEIHAEDEGDEGEAVPRCGCYAADTDA
ncbi:MULTISPECIES: hypothetical protein [unclassified Streptomyces]|nr:MULTISPECIES: hypothetical protein [unclassified Streptomyces]WSA91137.1 hypothetical protein OIE63_05945 [Streptomyces sp. NBC_01795]WSB75460.1 hypothetical protein OHB04_06475 [Streptomyces sp. NBC_01775]WSS16256.1 hypothetical protein OG533_33420 [Streptomyces sp. NBC_01186]WSS45072.1 hypothetical protein OG220_34095 [Streptomyces sp. NBC_01187]